jgi:glucose/arabinose dehydrogenase
MMRRMKWIALVLSISLGGFSRAAAAPSTRDPGLSVQEIASGLSAPTNIAFIGAEDILVLQKDDGQVRRVISGILQADPVLDVAVDSASERGLLGIAVHPDFPTSPFVYLYYTESSTGGDSSGAAAANRVYRYTWNGSVLTDPALILDLPGFPGPNHDGGIVTFGPDGKLYAVIGDLNRDGQLQNFAAGPEPDDTSVIFRINPDGSTPADNPFFASGGKLARYFAYGIRNSFGLAFDPVTDRLWMTENGPGSYDEINLVEPGFNSGWEKFMGPAARSATSVSELFAIAGAHYADPAFSWLNPVGPTAIAFLDSLSLGAEYENDVFVGDVNNGNLYRFKPNQSRDGFVFNGSGLADLVADNRAELAETVVASGFAGITDVKVGPDGRLYVVSFGDGKIYAISSALAPLSLATATLPNGEVGVAYRAELAVSGGAPPYAVTLDKGALPAGLNIVDTTIAGTPVRGKSSFTLRITDRFGASLSKRFSIPVVNAVAINNESLPQGRLGRRYNARLKAKGGKKPYVWSLIGGSLPSGVSFNSATASISGTPEAPGDHSVTFHVTDPLGGVAEKTLIFSVQ